jgi:hypothetical protein
MWTAAVHDASWLRVEPSNGTVDSNNPFAAITVVANASGLSDTRASGPLRSNITVVSSMAGASTLFMGGSSTLVMDVELEVIAAAYITHEDVVLLRADKQMFAVSEPLSAGQPLTVTVKTLDFERRPIPRPGQRIDLTLSTDRSMTMNMTMLYDSSNSYQAEVPGSWLQEAGSYTLQIEAIAEDVGGTGRVSIPFNVSRECAKGEWFDNRNSTAKRCQKRPSMTFKAASDSLSITAKKPNARADATALEVRLSSGDVDVDKGPVKWTVSSSVRWLRLEPLAGTVDSSSPAVKLTATVLTDGLNDTTSSGALMQAQITLRSDLIGATDRSAELFESSTHVLTMDVTVGIEATPCLNQTDLPSVMTSSAEPVASGGTVSSGDKLNVKVAARDIDRLPIAKPGLPIGLRIVAQQASMEKADKKADNCVTMLHSSGTLLWMIDHVATHTRARTHACTHLSMMLHM